MFTATGVDIKKSIRMKVNILPNNLAGWNAVPISLTFPITVFIVENIVGKYGCSLGP